MKTSTTKLLNARYAKRGFIWRKVSESVVEIERNDYRRLERIK
jgi:hypothetical protein